MNQKFKCKDEVIYKDKNTDKWCYGIYSHAEADNIHMLVGNITIVDGIFELLPYKGNEHLVGTNINVEPYFIIEKGAWIMVSDFGNINDMRILDWNLRRFDHIEQASSGRWYFVDDIQYKWNFAIPFEKFNPNNFEETRKHCLKVENGLIISSPAN